MTDFFQSSDCLCRQLSAYFGENVEKYQCNHCSTCGTGKGAVIRPAVTKSLDSYDFNALTEELTNEFKSLPSPISSSAVLTARFLCGISSPFMTKIHAKELKAFGKLEEYRYAEVLEWVNAQRGRIIPRNINS